jgi:hypothetical protein
MKYLGEASRPEPIKRAIAISAPLDLEKGSLNLKSTLYEKRFLKKLTKKIRLKHAQYPKRIPIDLLKVVDSLYTFDDLFTAPLHGFKNARDYYQQCSSINFVNNVDRPLLILNAQNDPFLTRESLYQSAIHNPKIKMVITNRGGHCGYYQKPYYWSDIQALDYVKSMENNNI